jgi:hypothetical protein
MDATERDIVDLMAAFEATTLDPARWTHAAHLIAALYYIRRDGRALATARMRTNLQRYNAVVGTNPAAYHETITLAWVAVVAGFVAEQPDLPLADAARALVARCGTKDYLDRHYSPETLLSADARARWVPPDRLPLDPP